MRTNIWNYEKGQLCNHEVAESNNRESLRLLWEVMLEGALDLHTHSNVSDGKTSPPQLVQEVLTHRLKVFALTDHDTIAGIEAISMLYEKLSQMGIDLPDFFPGVEISAELDGQEVHLLGYYPSGSIRCLDGYLQERRMDREARNRLLCAGADSLGMPIQYSELSSEGGHVVGRLHMAQILIRKGYVTSVKEAFEHFLAEGKPLYIKRDLPAAETAIKQIRQTGGVPVLAHPALYKGWLRGEQAGSEADLQKRFAALQAVGLQGVEVVHGETVLAESRVVAAAAASLELLPTVGSDYHGSHKPHVHLYKDTDDFRPFLAEYFKEFQ